MSTTPTSRRPSYHDSTAPLTVPKRLQYGLGWSIGVFAEPVEPTTAFGRGADVQRNTIEIWHQGFGRWYPEADLNEAITDALRRTVEDLELAIAGLTAHRDRLAAELARRPEAPASPVQEGLPI